MSRWYAMSSHFLGDHKIEALGERHGPAGPLLVVALLGHASIQEAAGQVERTYRSAAHETFTDADTVRATLDTAAEIGLLEVEQNAGPAFRVRFHNWERWQGAFRKARQREKPSDAGNVTGSPAMSRDVPDKTRQDKTRTRQDKTAKAQTEVKGRVAAGRDDAPLSHLLADLIAQNGSRRPRVGKGWADAERLLFELDQREPAEAERLVRWCQADEFWRANVLSMPKFREQYDRLRLQASRGGVTFPELDALEARFRAEEEFIEARTEAAE